MLFAVTAINYADRSALSIAGPAAAKQFGLSPISIGYIFSAFGWAYVLGQIPGGWLLDRFGSKRVYAVGLLCWSIFTGLQGFAGDLRILPPAIALFTFLFVTGLAESPSLPGNARIVAAWFPPAERGMASAIFNSAQYFATVVFAPLMGWITHSFGWQYTFWMMGSLGIALTPVWWKVIHMPKQHPRITRSELKHLESGGALLDMSDGANQARIGKSETLSTVKQLLENRMLLGIYIGQYCISTLTYFFLTWFPIYLIQGRGMSIVKAGIVASLPALCGFGGGVLGGVFSDRLLKKGSSLSVSRKTPIVIGMVLSTSMILCKYVNAQWVIVSIMCFAFLGKGIGALGWAVISDTAPKVSAGLCGSIFNTFGNAAAITTPIIIGHIVEKTKSFNGALIFVAANAIGAVASYIFVVGDIKRVELSH